MRKNFLATGILLGAASLLTPRAAYPQTNAPAPQAFNPSFGDLMNMLVQPRHAKLGIAGQQQNWPLAAYSIHELKDALSHIARLKPRFRNNPVADMMANATGEPIKALEQATQAADLNRFKEAYARLTEGCNSCHAALNHSFVVIKAPDQSVFPNQDFRPVK